MRASPSCAGVFLESGAGCPAFWLERIHVGVAGAMRKSGYAELKRSPIEYFQRRCFISADPDEPGIALAKQTLGDGCIVAPTDFSHTQGEGYVTALGDILALPGLGEKTRRKIIGDDAARLYGVS